jgi:predicted Zn-dependent protease
MTLCKKATAILMVLLFLLVPYPAPDAAALTIQEEQELAEEFLRTVRQRYHIIRDPVIADYIQQLGERILRELPPQPFEYHFYVIEQDVYNAFAGPAGHIFVFSGLFEALSHEGELAALLAHEIAHASCRHISEMIASSKKTQIGTLAGVIAGILVGIGGASAVGNALAIGSMAAGKSAALAYTREKEMQADQIGREYLTKAGYDLHSMLSLLKKIRSQEWFSTDEIPTYLRTHPATEDRLAYLSSTLSSRPAPPPEPSHAFERAHARLSALYGNAERSLERFREKAQSRPQDPAARYGYGLALERSGNPEAAIRQLEAVRASWPEDPHATADLGRLYFQTGRHEKALALLEEAAGRAETGPEGRLYLGRAQLALEKPGAAVETLKQLVAAYPDYLPGLYFLGKGYAAMDAPGDAHYNLGLYHMGRNDLEAAAHHFRQALKSVTDSKKVEKINDLLKKSRS